jgi:hypothetical protein
MIHEGITTELEYLQQHVELIQGLWSAWFGPVGKRSVTFDADTVAMTAAWPYPVVKHMVDVRTVGPFTCLLMATASREIHLMEKRHAKQADLRGELFVVTHMQVKVHGGFWQYAAQAGIANAEAEWPFPEPNELERFFWLQDRR